MLNPGGKNSLVHLTADVMQPKNMQPSKLKKPSEKVMETSAGIIYIQ